MNTSFLKDAARQALKTVGSSVGINRDDDLILYKKLLPSDFPKLIEKMGAERTFAYIKEMESRLRSEGE